MIRFILFVIFFRFVVEEESWYTSPIIDKNSLTVTISIHSSYVDKQVTGIRYLGKDTPCDLKKTPLYSSTDANLPSASYFN